MNTIKLVQLKNLFADYCNQRNYTRPLMLWFANSQTLYNVEEQLLQDSSRRTIKIKEDGLSLLKISQKGTLPEEYSEDVDRIIYRTDCVLSMQAGLDYCCHVLDILQKPFICLMRDSDAFIQNATNKAYLDKNFEQFFVIERTYDEWMDWAKETNLISHYSLLMYLNMHLWESPDWWIASPSLQGMPEEAIHTREPLLTNLLKMIRKLQYRDYDESGNAEEKADKIELVMKYVESTALKDIIGDNRFREILDECFSM